MSEAMTKDKNRILLERGLESLQKARALLDKGATKSEPVAIIGMGCRFPGNVNDPAAFWRLLKNGTDAISEIPADRWNVDEYYHPNPDEPGKMYTRSGGFLNDVDKFDPRFFNISPREAASMDPQQRLLLETTWEAIEHAGRAPSRLAGSRAGVFVGISTNDYASLFVKQGDPELLDAYYATGNAINAAAGRLSYVLDLHGPSVSVDTACSSSLVTVHLACQGLLAGDCEMALAGGVNLMLIPEGHLTLSKAKMMAADGRCKTFDAAADGYVRGEGCGMIVLKRLSDAQRDGDNVLALIRGSAVNQDGAGSGLTVPNGHAQQALIRETLRRAKVEPADVDYIEAHGTGTSLGDPIEVRALAKVFGEGRSDDKPLVLGSVKTNFGHLESAAGIAGVMKVVLALQHREIPPHLHFKNLNPDISLDAIPAVIPTEPRSWVENETPRLAGVSSFGASGTIAHVVLQEAPPMKVAKVEHKKPLRLLTLSGKSEESLRELATRFASFSALNEKFPEISLADMCFTANTGRSHFAHRLAISAGSLEQLHEQLAGFAKGQKQPGIVSGHLKNVKPPSIAFLFTGQGAQYAGMGQKLYETEPVFRAALDRCDEILRNELDVPLLDVIFAQNGDSKNIPLTPFEGGITGSSKTNSDSPLRRGAGGDVSEHSANSTMLEKPTPSPSLEGNRADAQRPVYDLINQTAYTQPALFAIEYALSELWRSWGVEPGVVMGHSVGEYVAATVAGVTSLEDGLKLIAARGRLMQSLPQNGAMAAVFAEEKNVAETIAPFSEKVSIAAANGPENIVISGEKTAIEEILQKLETAGVKHKKLTVSHAFHSPLMEPILDEFERAAEGIEFKTPRVPLISNVTGESIKEFDAKYWREHIRQAVRFSDSIAHIHGQGCSTFLEIGPNPTLSGMGARCLPDAECAWIPSLRSGRDDCRQILTALGTLYVNGAEIDWEAFEKGAGGRRVPLPTYAFQRERFWLKESKSGAGRKRAARQSELETPLQHPLLARKLNLPLAKETVFESEIGVAIQPFLDDHRVYGTPVFPATAYLEMALTAAKKAFGAGQHRIKEMVIQEALILDGEIEKTMQLILTRETPERATFRILTFDRRERGAENAWRLHASGAIAVEQKISENGFAGPQAVSLEKLQSGFQEELSVEKYYEDFRQSGIEYGPAFQGITQVWRGGGEALGRIKLMQTLAEDAAACQIHPALLDSCFQLLGAALSGNNKKENASDIFLPLSVESVAIHTDASESGKTEVWCRARTRDGADLSGEIINGDLELFDDTGRLIAEINGLHLKRADQDALKQAFQARLNDWLYRLAWKPQTLSTNGSAKMSDAAGRWLVFTEPNGAGRELADQLQAHGGDCVTVFADENFRALENGDYQIDPRSHDDFQRLFDEAALKNDPPFRGIVYCWSLEKTFAEKMSGTDLQDAMLDACENILHLVQGVAMLSGAEKPRLWLVTQGAEHVDSQKRELDLSAAPLWGLGRTIAIEHPELRCTRIDFDPEKSEADDHETGDLQRLVDEILADDAEDQIAFRGGLRHVARLIPVADKKQDDHRNGRARDFHARQLQIKQRGVLDNLAYERVERRKSGADEIEISVRATGLNFRDVLNALGMYPGDPGPLGGECAGVVTAVGEGVENLKIGDEVIALGGGCFADFVTTKADWAAHKPVNLSFEEAATIPMTFLTAWYGFHELTQISPGQKILIHSAAGGVGIAAIQLARQAGAKVYGTASRGKWDYVESLGVEMVMDSRTLDFADQVMEATKGAGVDVVLNSLADDFIPKSLGVLSDNGCFLEIGKRGILTDEQAAELGRGLSYFAFDLGNVMLENPAVIQKMYAELLAGFESGDLKPLPLKVFEDQEAAGAFRYMAQAKHIGKIVVARQPADVSDEPSPVTIKADATYFITGGLGGLGWRVAEWLVERGAKNLALAGRSAPSEKAVELIQKLQSAGAKILVARGDVSNAKDVQQALADIQTAKMPELRGIIHAAGVLDDGVMLQQNRERFGKVMSPKIAGAWNLHRATQNQKLDFFVLFSSVSSLLGSAGQGGYAAANAFLDAFAHFRRAQGLAALSVNWGPWAEVGMAAKLADGDQQRMKSGGMDMIAPKQGLQILESLFERPSLGQVGVLPIYWPDFLAQFPDGQPPAFLSEAVRRQQTTIKKERAPEGEPDLMDRLRKAAPREQKKMLTAFIRTQVGNILGYDSGKPLDVKIPFQEMGFDSLMAVELRNSIGGALDCTLSATLLFEHPTIEALRDHLIAELFTSEAEVDAQQSDHEKQEEQELVLEEINELSEEEAEASIMEELKKIAALE